MGCFVWHKFVFVGLLLLIVSSLLRLGFGFVVSCLLCLLFNFVVWCLVIFLLFLVVLGFILFARWATDCLVWLVACVGF